MIIISLGSIHLILSETLQWSVRSVRSAEMTQSPLDIVLNKLYPHLRKILPHNAWYEAIYPLQSCSPVQYLSRDVSSFIAKQDNVVNMNFLFCYI